MRVYNLPKYAVPSEPAVWLQEIGWVEAIPASQLIPGQKVCFNLGYRAEITTVTVQGRWIYIEVLCTDGTPYTIKKRSTTLVPYEKSQAQITEEVRQNLIKGATNGL
jgi:hypothetical protein